MLHADGGKRGSPPDNPAQITGDEIGRLLLIKPNNDTDLPAQAFKRFLLPTARTATFHIAAAIPVNFERTAEYTLSVPQKVGRTIENAVLSSNHKDILTPCGYKTH